MLPRKNRLTSKSSFSRVYRNGRRLAASHLVLFVFSDHTPSQDRPRFGFVVGKKHVGKIVRRNRVKRMFRTTVRNYLNILKPYEIIIQAKPGIDKLSSREVREQLIYMLDKLKKPRKP